MSFSNLFHLARCPLSPSMLLQIFIIFFAEYGIPLCVCIHTYIYRCIFFTYSSFDGQLDFFHTWLLYIMLLWTLEFNITFELVLLFSLAIYLWVQLVFLFLVFWGIGILFFHSDCTNLHSHQQDTVSSISSHPHQHLLLVNFWMIAILTGMVFGFAFLW